MRTEEFKMERENLVEIGEEVEIVERNTIAFYYYIVVSARAMSGNFPFNNRIKARTGVVKDIRRDERGIFAYIEFKE